MSEVKHRRKNSNVATKKRRNGRVLLARTPMTPERPAENAETPTLLGKADALSQVVALMEGEDDWGKLLELRSEVDNALKALINQDDKREKDMERLPMEILPANQDIVATCFGPIAHFVRINGAQRYKMLEMVPPCDRVPDWIRDFSYFVGRINANIVDRRQFPLFGQAPKPLSDLEADEAIRVIDRMVRVQFHGLVRCQAEMQLESTESK